MPVVLLLAAIAILAGVVVVAIGRGGELTVFRSDTPPLRLEFATAADLARFRPPSAFFGYSAQVTDDALQLIARVVADREAELAMLRRQLATLRASPAPATPAPARPAPPSPAPPSFADARFEAGRPADSSPSAGRPPEPTDWTESRGSSESEGWSESDGGIESEGWSESGGGSVAGGWSESQPEARGWSESGGWPESEPDGGTGASGWSEPGDWAEPGSPHARPAPGRDVDPDPDSAGPDSAGPDSGGPDSGRAGR